MFLILTDMVTHWQAKPSIERTKEDDFIHIPVERNGRRTPAKGPSLKKITSGTAWDQVKLLSG